MYHAVLKSVDPALSEKLYVTEEEFSRQMNALKNAGYSAVTFAQLFSAFDGIESLPAKPFLVTFDDGYDGVYQFARPVLERLKMPYTVFLVTDLVGKTNEWDASKGFPSLRLMDWNQIEEMDRAGDASFEPHTLTHARLSEVPAAEAKRQVCQSRAAIEQRLGKRSHVFCYPYGAQSDSVVQITKDAGYDFAVTTDFGRVRRDEFGLKLPRVAVHHVPPISLTYGIAGPNFWWRIKSRIDKRP
jgi:peptidoglycan/xylan/chitin deacetylase (PgdA/CDA1 family)